MEGNGQVNNVVNKCDKTRPLPKNVYLQPFTKYLRQTLVFM